MQLTRGSHQGCHRGTMRSVAVVPHGQQSEEYQEGSQCPGSSIKTLCSTGSFFPRVLLVSRNGLQRASWIWWVNKWLQDWCHSYLNHGTCFEKSNLLGADRVHPSENDGGGEPQSITLLWIWCVPAIDIQNLKQHHKSVREHLKSSKKEFQPLQSNSSWAQFKWLCKCTENGE